MLLLYHPGVASIDCNDCQKRLYDYDTGKPKTWKGSGGKKIYADGPSHKPQCKTSHGCPKGSPEEAAKIELTPKNWKTLRLYRQLRVANFRFMTDSEKNDRILRKHFGILDEIYREWELKQQANDLARSLAPIMLKKMF